MTQTDLGYAQSEGMKLLESAVQELGPVFTLERLKLITEQQGLSTRHLRKLTSMLAASGWLEILKRGTYAVTRSPLFADEIHPFAIATALVQPAAVSHWSALAQHGFTTQMPIMVQASTPRKVVTPEMRKGQSHRPRGRAVWQALGMEIEFIHVQQRQFFGHQTSWINRWQQVAITDPERTVLDLIARPDVFGGVRAAIDIFESALPRIEVTRLVRYALEYSVGAVIKRLGWLLDQSGIPASETEPLQAYPVTTYYRLDPQSAPNVQYNARWRIIENLRTSLHA